MGNDRSIRCFLCRCHGEISRVIDLDEVARALKSHPGVRSLDVRNSLCLEEDMDVLASRVEDPDATGLVLGACSLYARGDRIRTALEEKGISPDTVEVVDIREGCSWIHHGQPREATTKAIDLLRMGVALQRHRENPDEVMVDPVREVFVLGAGPAGISAAASLVRLGVRVHLLDRAKSPGGLLNLVKRIAPEDVTSDEYLSQKQQTIFASNGGVSHYPGAKLISAHGSAGDFTISFSSGKTEHAIRVGAVIVATGAKILMPDGLYRHGNLEGVLTGIELERRFKAGQLEGNRVVFIQCVGVRDRKRPYCSAICCIVSLKQACQVLDVDPQAEVFVLHRDIMCPGSVLEKYYRDAMARGVRFLRYEQDRPPVVLGDENVDSVEVYDALTSEMRRIKADLVVLSTPLAPHDDAGRIAELFGLNRDEHGFYEVRTLMHPLETKREGVFVCGSARWPVLGRSAVLQGEAAAMKAYELISRGTLAASRLSTYRERKFSLARVDHEACTGCGNCVAVCPYDACSLEKKEGALKSTVNLIRCSGCGSCVSVCPNGSIQLPGHSAMAIGEMLKAVCEQGS
ncbi:MAG TPA: CoB--CoM heterodisulfide reductase iron-sulfur subunit A family protein [Deltaproteobacteria bacterium]|nr:CoB--CoM heterodisulfide reductase iron-sulfur subunit A family protein [Deltaproteobacteria bacterium]